MRVSDKKKIDPNTAAALLFIIWLFAPFRLGISNAEGGFYFQVLAMTWVYNIWPDNPDQFVFFDSNHFLTGIFYGLFLMIFIISIVRYLQHSTTKKRVLLSAILSQCLIIFEMMIYLITRFPFSTGFILSLPVPFLITAGILMIRGIDSLSPKTPWSDMEI